MHRSRLEDPSRAYSRVLVLISIASGSRLDRCGTVVGSGRTATIGLG